MATDQKVKQLQKFNRENDLFEFANEFRQRTIQYPVDLTQQSKAYMTFYISVDARSFSASEKNSDNIAGDVDVSGQNRIGKNFDGTLLGQATKDEEKKSDGNKSDSGSIVGALGDGVAAVGGAVKDAASKTTSFGVPNKLLKTTITLPMPLNLTTNYGINYTDEIFGPLDQLLFNNVSPAQYKDMAASMKGGIATAAARIMATSVAQKADSAINKGQGVASNISGAIAKSTGQIFNNRREKTFSDVNTRRFSFEFQFAPRDENECFKVREIIQTFKYHMHPELTDNQLFYIFPSEFDIAFYFDGKENIWINRISTCVLESMSVNYAPGSSFAALSNGHPVMLSLQLNFGELETLTKERIIPKGGEFQGGQNTSVTKWSGGY